MPRKNEKRLRVVLSSEHAEAEHAAVVEMARTKKTSASGLMRSLLRKAYLRHAPNPDKALFLPNQIGGVRVLTTEENHERVDDEM